MQAVYGVFTWDVCHAIIAAAQGTTIMVLHIDKKRVLMLYGCVN